MLDRSAANPEAEKAIEELNKMREIQCYLVTHFLAVKRQTEASAAGLDSLLNSVKTGGDAPPHLAGRLLK
jgi:hypothetical protein